MFDTAKYFFPHTHKELVLNVWNGVVLSFELLQVEALELRFGGKKLCFLKINLLNADLVNNKKPTFFLK